MDFVAVAQQLKNLLVRHELALRQIAVIGKYFLMELFLFSYNI